MVVTIKAPLSERYLRELKELVSEWAARGKASTGLRMARIREEYRHLVGQLGKEFVEEELQRIVDEASPEKVESTAVVEWASQKLDALDKARYFDVRETAMISILRSFLSIERPEFLELGPDKVWKLLSKAVSGTWEVS